MGCRNEEGSSSFNAIVPVHDFAQHKIISMKKKNMRAVTLKLFSIILCRGRTKYVMDSIINWNTMCMK